MKSTLLAFTLCVLVAFPSFAQDPAPETPDTPETPALESVAETPDPEPASSEAPPAVPFDFNDELDLTPRRDNPFRRAAESIGVYREDSFYNRFVAERVSVGVLYSATSMDKTHVPYDPTKAGNFLGNINRLSEDDMEGLGVMVRVNLCDYFALQLSTGTHIELGMWNNDDLMRDATFVADGVAYEALVMYPVDIRQVRIIPYVGLGWTDFSCSIDYDNWWHYGWSSPKDYDRYGNGSTEPRHDVMRWMEFKEPGMAVSFSLGASVRLCRYAYLDLFYRMIDADDGSIWFWRSDTAVARREGYIPLACDSYGIALRALF
ncbi:MAG: hypothetical protein ACOX5G_08650 [Kiritimatiellia bacterium]|jgi:hypothetical protein